VDKDDRRADLLAGISAGFPIGRTQGIRVAYVLERTRVDVASELDSLAVGWVKRF
jgi:hypothetical protein